MQIINALLTISSTCFIKYLSINNMDFEMNNFRFYAFLKLKL